MKYGKTPARPGAMKLALGDYLDMAKLPPVPSSFGHDGIMPQDWGMFGNDQYGCCVWAGAAHETVMWNKEAGNAVAFSTQDVLDDYAAVTGFNPSDPNSDNGTDMVKAAEYRRTVGIRDMQGRRHKVAAYVSLNPSNLDHLWAATYLFGAIGIGIQVPDTADDQFSNSQPWTYVPSAKIVGGHYVPLVGRSGALLRVVTWGRIQRMTLSFIENYCDEAIAYISPEMLKAGKSPEGFDQARLIADLPLLKA